MITRWIWRWISFEQGSQKVKTVKKIVNCKKKICDFRIFQSKEFLNEIMRVSPLLNGACDFWIFGDCTDALCCHQIPQTLLPSASRMSSFCIHRLPGVFLDRAQSADCCDSYSSRVGSQLLTIADFNVRMLNNHICNAFEIDHSSTAIPENL